MRKRSKKAKGRRTGRKRQRKLEEGGEPLQAAPSHVYESGGGWDGNVLDDKEDFDLLDDDYCNDDYDSDSDSDDDDDDNDDIFIESDLSTFGPHDLLRLYHPPELPHQGL